jgi:hypothetical protein
MVSFDTSEPQYVSESICCEVIVIQTDCSNTGPKTLEVAHEAEICKATTDELGWSTIMPGLEQSVSFKYKLY